jgi:hypothetical protein
MDPQLIDQNYQQLERQSQQTIGALSTLSQKLQNAAQSGDQNAREWQLDLREIALGIQQEQNQVSLLLQAIHNFVASNAPRQAPPQQAPQYQQPQYQQPPQQQPQYQPQVQQQAYPQQQYQQQGGAFHNFLSGNFGRAIMQGAGFGIGDDLINHLFD